METNYSRWKDDQVKELFNFIEQGKKQNESLSALFASFAKKTQRQPNSVRNYYYAELRSLEKDENRRKKLNIDLSLHQKIDQKEFTLQETKDIVTKILRLTSKGVSVRKACLMLANGDIAKMVRFQNKFRSVIVKEKEIYDQCFENLKKEGFNVKQRPNNVISIPDRRNVLSESDINSLFLGLVKLVKKQATEQASEEFKKDTQKANDMLRRTLVELSEKENEIKKLRSQFKVLSCEKDKLMEEIKHLRANNLELTTKNFKQLKKITNKQLAKLNS